VLAPWPALTVAVAIAALASCTDRAISTDDAGADTSDGAPNVPDGGGPDGGGSPDDGGDPNDGSTSTEGPGDGGATGTDDGWTTDDDWPTGDGGAFIYGEPDGGVVGQCDPGLQDCPNPDEKCTAYVSEPGYCCVDANKCVPIIGNKTFGEICERTEENDDCDKGFFCMAKTSGSTGQGVCLEFCVPNAPDQCQFGGACMPFNDGVLPICETECDPLLQDCPEEWGCYAAFDIFVCATPGHEDGEGFDGDECYAIQSCVPGFECVVGDATAGCTGEACCTPFCDVNGDASQCPEPTEECVPWFEPGQEPPGLDNVGTCQIPP